MGKTLLDAGLVPDFVITSSATRALETAKAMTLEMGFTGALEVTSHLYLAEPSGYLDVLDDVPAEFQVVLVIGHNPGVSELLEQITGVSEDMATATIAQVRLPSEGIAALRNGRRAEFVRFYKPPKDPKNS